MNEVLFRGKRTDNGEWIEGCYLDRNNIGIFYDDTEEEDCQVHIFPVYSNTIGQYTGLTDKNGKKIFEGDIVRTRRFETYQEELKGYHGYDSEGYPIKIPGYKGSMFVTREKMNYDYRAVVKRDRRGGYYLSDTTMFIDAICNEVIGNIHDNPELLNKPIRNE